MSLARTHTASDWLVWQGFQTLLVEKERSILLGKVQPLQHYNTSALKSARSMCYFELVWVIKTMSVQNLIYILHNVDRL